MVLSSTEAYEKVTREKGLCSITTFKSLSCANKKTHLIRETASPSSVNKLNNENLIKRRQSMWNDIGSAPASGMDSIFEQTTSNFAAVNPMAKGVVIRAEVNQNGVFQDIFEALLSSKYVSEDNQAKHKAAVAACGISEPNEIEFLIQMTPEIEKIAYLITSLGKLKLEKALAQLTPPVIIASINVSGVAPVILTSTNTAVVPPINLSHVATPVVSSSAKESLTPLSNPPGNQSSIPKNEDQWVSKAEFQEIKALLKKAVTPIKHHASKGKLQKNSYDYDTDDDDDDDVCLNRLQHVAS